jgi:hypothetical protein
MINVSQTFFAVLQRETGSEATKPDREDIVAHIRTLGAEDVHYDKPHANLELFERIQKRHWMSAFQRRRRGLVGFSLCNKALYFTICRQGAICKDPDYPGSGLKYEVRCILPVVNIC